jgi:hypothetical protein
MFRPPRLRSAHLLLAGALTIVVSSFLLLSSSSAQGQGTIVVNPQDPVVANAERLILEGRETFRYDTLGDEAFWGGQLRLHEAINGAVLGGVGTGVTPRAALQLGLKVDFAALSPQDASRLRQGSLNLDAVSTTMSMLRFDAVVGIKGFFNSAGDRLTAVGITCALCHSTVDDSVAPGVGLRLDGLANRDLNVGAIAASAPNLQPVADLLGVSVATVRTVLNSWGAGKFDAQLLLDGKAFNPVQMSHGVVTGTNVPGATMLPNALGLLGFNQHTWTGSWGTVTYWNAFVGNIEMHGKGTFYDPRLDNPVQFPIAAANGFGHLKTPPDEDRITPKLGALHFYQLALQVPVPIAGVDYSPPAAQRGSELFTGRALCNNCHVKPLFTEPGWNLHAPSEIGIDSFQADRAPDHAYKTQNLAALFIRENGRFMNPANKGRFYHDGRFATLLDVVNHYDAHFPQVDLTQGEKLDLVEYLKSLPEPIPSQTAPNRFQIRR